MELILQIRQPPHETGNNLFQHLTKGFERYEHTIARLGGFWSAQWFMPLNADNSEDFLRSFFSSYLGCGVEERTPTGMTWQGLVWSMELTLGGLTRRLDREKVYNAIRCIATDTDGNKVDTAASTNLTIDSRGYHSSDASIARYGRRELVFTMSEADMAEAEAAVQKELALSAFPEAAAVDADPQAEPGLMVECVGRVFLIQDVYVSVNNSTGTDPINLSQYITEILAADVDTTAVSAALISTNTTQTRRIAPEDTPVRAWDKIQELTEIGDSDGDPWVFTVMEGGRVRYEQAETTPRYHWTTAGPTTLTGMPVSWDMQPAILRDVTGMHALGSNAAPESSFLRDARDMWPDEVTMTSSGKYPRLSMGGFSANELLRNYRKHLEYLDRQEKELNRQ